MKRGDVVVWRLVPADQNAPETVHPTVSPFHNPTPGFEAGDGLGLFTSAKDGQVRLRWTCRPVESVPPAGDPGFDRFCFGSDVGGDKLVQGLPHLIEVVALADLGGARTDSPGPSWVPDAARGGCPP